MNIALEATEEYVNGQVIYSSYLIPIFIFISFSLCLSSLSLYVSAHYLCIFPLSLWLSSRISTATRLFEATTFFTSAPSRESDEGGLDEDLKLLRGRETETETETRRTETDEVRDEKVSRRIISSFENVLYRFSMPFHCPSLTSLRNARPIIVNLLSLFCPFIPHLL